MKTRIKIDLPDTQTNPTLLKTKISQGRKQIETLRGASRAGARSEGERVAERNRGIPGRGEPFLKTQKLKKDEEMEKKEDKGRRNRDFSRGGVRQMRRLAYYERQVSEYHLTGKDGTEKPL